MEIERTPIEEAKYLFEQLGNKRAESLVNGIWFGVLRRLFPSPEFIIAPEHWTDRSRPGGSRVDLVVYSVQRAEPIFVYEGKGNVENLSFSPDSALESILSAGLEENLNQIKRYIRAIPKVQGQTSYGMLAQGTQFIFMTLDDGNRYHRIQYPTLGPNDENFNIFRDFNSTRFSVEEADEILEAIANRVKGRDAG